MCESHFRGTLAQCSVALCPAAINSAIVVMKQKAPRSQGSDKCNYDSVNSYLSDQKISIHSFHRFISLSECGEPFVEVVSGSRRRRYPLDAYRL